MSDLQLLVRVSQEVHFRNHKYFDGEKFVKEKQSHEKLLQLIHTAKAETEEEKADLYTALASLKTGYQQKSTGLRRWMISSKALEHYKKTELALDNKMKEISPEHLEPTSKEGKISALFAKLRENGLFRLPKPCKSSREKITEFLAWLESKDINVSVNNLHEMFCGAHVMVQDDRELYNSLSPNSTPRISSHHSDAPQLHQSDSFSGEFLFGTSGDYTWFQFENSPFEWLNPLSYITHGFDYLTYRITGMNVGPYGLSPHTDSDPLTLSAGLSIV